ncbi:uncharacterized protein I303_103971 [Kwoniella dejecticola CBS 10117]|uniref:Uncharacterized protein n=1 Tax=Kwoniella dejecticola CBS 10117 TaxID=1296121 RepID=A0A1A6A887_9TREE|nr:uncharacterized protein I303_03988 [Kwoniella dejecticola CBS 10117]OBR86266.1 hypothetical protein I303_03988 [Kwoniella dejecticola CBS 10117]
MTEQGSSTGGEGTAASMTQLDVKSYIESNSNKPNSDGGLIQGTTEAERRAWKEQRLSQEELFECLTTASSRQSDNHTNNTEPAQTGK